LGIGNVFFLFGKPLLLGAWVNEVKRWVSPVWGIVWVVGIGEDDDDMKSIVKLPDGTYINPKYVVRIEVRTSNVAQSDPRTLIWVSDGGWATSFEGDRRDEMAALLFPCLNEE